MFEQAQATAPAAQTRIAARTVFGPSIGRYLPKPALTRFRDSASSNPMVEISTATTARPGVFRLLHAKHVIISRHHGFDRHQPRFQLRHRRELPDRVFFRFFHSVILRRGTSSQRDCRRFGICGFCRFGWTAVPGGRAESACGSGFVVRDPGGGLRDGVCRFGRGTGGADCAIQARGPRRTSDRVDCGGGDGVAGEELRGDVVAVVGDFADGALCLGGGGTAWLSLWTRMIQNG